MSKLVQLVVSNVKKIRYARINPDGSVFTVAGNNDQGKTSLLDSIMFLFGGKKLMPEMPLRTGAVQGVITGLEDDGTTTTRKIGKGESLSVTDKDGNAIKEPQKVCEAKVNSLLLDPLEFMRMNATEQLDRLKKLVGLDFTQIDVDSKAEFDRRTEQNRAVKALEAQVAALPVVAADLQPVVVEDLLKEQAAINDANALRETRIREAETKLEAIARDVGTAEKKYKDLTEEIKQAQIRIRELQAEIAKQQGVIEDRQKALGTNKTWHDTLLESHAAVQKVRDEAKATPVQSGTEIQSKIINASSVNRQVEQREQRKKLEADLAAAKSAAARMTEKIEHFERLKASQMANAKMPVEGLAFDDSRVLYNGIPLDQAGAATQLKVSASIAMGLANENSLKVLLVRDGSLLDVNSRKILNDLAAERGFTVFLEIVGNEGDVVLENGEIRGQEAPQENKEK